MIQKYLELIETYLNKIPGHIQDVIAKAGIALAAIAVLFGIGFGWNKGANSAQPKGLQMAKNTEDVLAEEIQKLKQKKTNIVKHREDNFEFLDENKTRKPRFYGSGQDSDELSNNSEYPKSNSAKRKSIFKNFSENTRNDNNSYVPGLENNGNTEANIFEDNNMELTNRKLQNAKKNRIIKRRQNDYLDDSYSGNMMRQQESKRQTSNDTYYRRKHRKRRSLQNPYEINSQDSTRRRNYSEEKILPGKPGTANPIVLE